MNVFLTRSLEGISSPRSAVDQSTAKYLKPRDSKLPPITDEVSLVTQLFIFLV